MAYAVVRGGVELGVGPTAPGLQDVIFVAQVARVVTVDEWEALFNAVMMDGGEFPIYRAASAAVERWGGALLIECPWT